MSKRFALFDFDKTLYDGFSLLGVAEAQVQAGLIEPSIPDKIKQTLHEHETGALAYEDMAQQQLELYATSLQDKTYEDAFQTSLQFFRTSDRIFSFAKPVIELLDETHETALVTAFPEHGAKAAAAVLGVLSVYCSEYEVQAGKFTGKVSRSLAGRGGKHACILQIEQEHSMAESFVFGDSEGDIEMLRAATHAICVNPSEGLRAEAEANGWHICTPDQVEPTVRQLLGKS